MASSNSDEKQIYFGVVDYIIFALTLLLSGVIGVFLAVKHRKSASSEEYLLANRTMSWFPLFASMVASFFSAVGVMGMPSQMYTTGITFAFHMFSFFLPICLCAEIFTPIYRRLNLVSVNEYLEKRFSPGARYLGCLFFHVQFLMYLSVVLFAPSLALSSVAGIPLSITVISTGLVCTFYTSLGGMRAVIWTDVFQSFVMLFGLISTAIIGVLKVGSLQKVFEVANKWERLDISFNPDPRIYHSFWGTFIGMTFSVLGTWTTSQPTVQRVAAARTTGEAKRALYVSFFGIVVIMTLLTIDALVVFAVYVDCDLLMDKKITQNDQILPYFVVNKLGRLTGVPGLFTACLFSFALSTLSSGLNGMSALFYEDVVKKLYPQISEGNGTKFSKLAALAGGLFITGFAFVVPKLGNFILKITIQLFGIIGGPYFAMFALGIFSSTANSIGACSGALSGFIVGLVFAVGQMIYPPDRQLPPISIKGCASFNATLTNSTGIIYSKAPHYSEPFANLVAVSYVWHGMICISVSYLVGYLVSLCTKRFCQQKILDKDLIYNYNENWLIKRFHSSKKEEKYEMTERKSEIH